MKIRNNVALSESGFIFNPNTGESFTVNPMGFELFELIRQGIGFEEIRANIMEQYDVDEHIFEKDYDDFTHLLKHFQILEPDEQA
jgi:transcription elongation factor GreA-like protein